MNNLNEDGPIGKRLEVQLSSKAMADLAAVANEHHRLPNDIILLGISLAKIALDTVAKGGKLIVATDTGQFLEELRLPT